MYKIVSMFSRLAKIIISCVLLLLFVFVLGSQPFFVDISFKLSNFLFQSQVRVEGNRKVSNSEILSLIPEQLIIWDWRFNNKEILRDIKKISLVKSAEIEPCSFFSLNCYVIKILEHTPQFLMEDKGASWFISNDLTYLFSMPKHLDARKESKRLKLPFIKLSPNLTDNQTKQATKYAYDIINVLKSELQYKVSEIDFLPNGEFKVFFFDHDFWVSFSELDGSFEKLKTEIARLNEVINNSSGKLHVLQGIDLAFEKMAVVKFKELKK